MIHVFDAISAGKFCPQKKTIAIRCISPSIIKKGGYGELISSNYVGILPLVFDDVDPAYQNIFGYTLFNKNHARKIGDFLEINWGKFEDIMVHCHAGLSRSTAIGAAIGNHFNLEYDPEILERREDGPNNHVYTILLSSLEDRFPDRVIR